MQSSAGSPGQLIARRRVPLQFPLWLFLALFTAFGLGLGYVFQQPFASIAVEQFNWKHLADVRKFSREYACYPGWIGMLGYLFLMVALVSAWNRWSRSTLLESLLIAGLLLAFDASWSIVLNLSCMSCTNGSMVVDLYRDAVYSVFRWNGDIPLAFALAILVVAWFRGTGCGSRIDRIIIACGIIVIAKLAALSVLLILFIEVFHCGTR